MTLKKAETNCGDTRREETQGEQKKTTLSPSCVFVTRHPKVQQNKGLRQVKPLLAVTAKL